MSTSKHQIERQNIDGPGCQKIDGRAQNGELMPFQQSETINHKVAGISLDDAYIFNFVNNPKMGKAEALRLAGWEGDPQYIRQEAYRRHNRLKARIQAVTAETMSDLGTLANHQLTNILNMDVSDTGLQGMLAAIKLGLEHSKLEAPSIIDEPKKSSEEITKRIESLTKLIQAAEGEAPPNPSVASKSVEREDRER